MRGLNKILSHIDYNNVYSFRKILFYLKRDFDAAIKNKDYTAAKDISDAVVGVYSNFSASKNRTGTNYKVSKDIESFISYLAKSLKNK